MPKTDELELLVIRPGVCYAALGDLVLLLYRDTPSVDDVKRREPLLARVARQPPEGAAFLSVIERSISRSLPDGPARKETARQVEAYKGVLRAGAMVLLGDRIEVSLVRTMLRSLLFLKRGPVDLRFFASIDEAALWCVEALGHRAVERPRRVASIVDAIEQMRAQAGFAPDDPRGSLVGG
ncbi:MAG: hypothetical protein DRJ42_08735 [Deltaproteobacteria bacterium]|nr:MAG: hypothetical protein DRJ42_08735 [Deltaproteobacteria bacterium]